MFQISLLDGLSFAFTFEVRLCEVSSTLLEGDVVAVLQQRSAGNGSDRVQGTDTRAAARVENGIRTFRGVVTLHLDERQPDGPAPGTMTIFRYDQKAAVGFVRALRFIDTVTRFDTRNVDLPGSGGAQRGEKQSKKKRFDHCFRTDVASAR